MQKSDGTLRSRVLKTLAEKRDSNGQGRVGAAQLLKLLQGEHASTSSNFAVGVYKLLKQLEQRQLVLGTKLSRAEGGLSYSLTDAGREWLESGSQVVSTPRPAPSRKALLPAAGDSSNSFVRLLELQAQASIAISRRMKALLELPKRLAALEQEIQEMKVMVGTVWTDQQGIEETRKALEKALNELGE